MPVEYRNVPEDKVHDAWEMDVHDYRVVFWRRQEPEPGYTPEEMGWSAVIHDVSAEDVHEVIEWANRKAAPDEIYTLYVAYVDPVENENGLLHIAGADPTVIPDTSIKFHRRHPHSG
jgi:hypothetical protein